MPFYSHSSIPWEANQSLASCAVVCPGCISHQQGNSQPPLVRINLRNFPSSCAESVGTGKAVRVIVGSTASVVAESIGRGCGVKDGECVGGATAVFGTLLAGKAGSDAMPVDTITFPPDTFVPCACNAAVGSISIGGGGAHPFAIQRTTNPQAKEVRFDSLMEDASCWIGL